MPIERYDSFVLLAALLALLSPYGAAAQTSTTSTSTVPEIPALPAIPPPAPQSMESGFSDYVNGLPTKLTLPDGTVIDLSIPENTLPEKITSLKPVPKVPKAYEDVTITVENYSTNLSEDRIIWSVDGRIVQDQIGGDQIVVRTGGIGVTTDIRVSIDSRTLEKRIVSDLAITPADVAILWEANTHVPPFYKGKPLPTYKSTLKLVPLPTVVADGRRLPPERLIYQWKRNYSVIKSISGYGKRSAVVETGTGVQRERLTLLVTDPESGAETERTVEIEVTEPKLLLYPGSPLMGIRYDRALGRDLVLVDQELTIKGEPFFFSNEELRSGAAPVVWTQNGIPVESAERTIVVRKPEEARGRSRIQASIENPSRILQNASAGVAIDFADE